MPQLLGHNSEGTAYAEPDYCVRYWVETRSPSKQVLYRKAPWQFEGQEILEAPVIVLVHEDGHIQSRYLNEMSTEAEIEAFTARYELNEQQRKWCFAALEEIAPVDRED